MALSINGTTGISGVDGSASAPALQGTDSNTGINFASDTVNINTGGVTRAKIDSSGRVGIGTTSPSTSLHNASDKTLTTGTAPQYRLNGTAADTTDDNRAIFGLATANTHFFNSAVTGDAILRTTNSGNLLFGVGQTERMRLTSDGKLLVKTTTDFFGGTDLGVNGQFSVGASGQGYRRQYYSSNNNYYFWNGTNQPYISTAGNWENASDVSLKKDITDITYGIDAVKSLKPRKYKMKSDDSEQIGFIAQEVESVIPEVVGTGVTPDGDEQKGLAYGNLVAVLTKALQESVAKIEVLETKVAALEAG